MPPMDPDMMEQMAGAMPKKKPMVAIGIKVDKMKPMSFKLPKGYASDNDDEVKEALLKFTDNGDGTATMVSLDGAPFKGGKSQSTEEDMPSEGQEMDMDKQDDEMPADMPMEDAITTLQKRDRMR